MVLALIYLRGIRIGIAPAILLSVCGLIAITLSETMLRNIYPLRPLWLGLPAAGIVAAVALGPVPTTTGLKWGSILFLGEASYALYLMHPFAITLPRYLGVTKADVATFPYIFSITMIASAIVIATLTHFFFERPALKLFRSGKALPSVRVATF
jgi:exopolysaccharide production protein ExoZ